MFTYKLKQIIDILVHPILWVITLFIDNKTRCIVQTWIKLADKQLKLSKSSTDNWRNYHEGLAKKFYTNAFLKYLIFITDTTDNDNNGTAQLAYTKYQSNTWFDGSPEEVKNLVINLIGWRFYLYSTFNYFNYLNAPALESF